MRPCIAGQKRFSLRMLQIAQLNRATSVAGTPARSSHYGIFHLLGVCRSRMSSGFPSATCGKTALNQAKTLPTEMKLV